MSACLDSQTVLGVLWSLWTDFHRASSNLFTNLCFRNPCFILGSHARREQHLCCEHHLCWDFRVFSEHDRWPSSREETSQVPTVLDSLHGQQNTSFMPSLEQTNGWMLFVDIRINIQSFCTTITNYPCTTPMSTVISDESIFSHKPCTWPGKKGLVMRMKQFPSALFFIKKTTTKTSLIHNIHKHMNFVTLSKHMTHSKVALSSKLFQTQ